MQLSEVLSQLYARLDFESAPPAAVTTRLTSFVNATQREVLRRKGMGPLHQRVLPFVTVADDPFAVLPQGMTKVVLVMDRSNNRRIWPKSMAWIQNRDPGQELTGPPDVFTVLDYASAVRADPLTTGESLSAVSTSNTDTSQTLYVQGITDAGLVQSGTIALNGVVPSTLPGVNNWVVITRWWMGGGVGASAGTVTLSTASGIELGSIAPLQFTPRYTRLQLNPTPASVQTLYAYGLVSVPDIVQASDETLIPDDFIDVLVMGALEKEYLKREKVSMAGTFGNKKEAIIAELRSYLASPQEAKGVGMDGFSALGPWFPAGS